MGRGSALQNQYCSIVYILSSQTIDYQDLRCYYSLPGLLERNLKLASERELELELEVAGVEAAVVQPAGGGCLEVEQGQLRVKAGPGAGEPLPLVQAGNEKQEQTEVLPGVVEAGKRKQKDVEEVAEYMEMECKKLAEVVADQQEQKKDRRQVMEQKQKEDFGLKPRLESLGRGSLELAVPLHSPVG